MRLRHAAALVIVGWYLMVPQMSCVWSLCRHPRPGDGCFITEQNAPLSKWRKWKFYSSGSACESARASLVVEEYFKGNIYGRCIESDDPRLRVN